MDIVIVANFCGDFSEKYNCRFKYLAEKLCKYNDVEIITSSFFHATKEQRDSCINGMPYKVTLIDEPGYSKNVCLKRFYSHYVWGRGVEKYLYKRKTPDVIYCAIPSLTAPTKVAKYCRNKKVKFVIDVLDLWPEAFQMVFDVPIIKDIVFLPFRIVVNKIYRSADKVCAVSQTYIDRVKKVNSKSKEYRSVFIGTDLGIFDKYALTKPLLRHKEGEIWIAYCGTLGKSYDLKCVIDSLNIIKNENVRLIVMGDGPQENEFKEYAVRKKVNVNFLGRVKYETMCAQLKECDITVNPIVGRSVASIINKHADYAASGLPVLNTQNSLEYIKLIRNYRMGFTSKSGDSNALAQNIQRLVVDNKLMMKMGENARRCAKECFDRRYTYNKLVEIITGDIYK